MLRIQLQHHDGSFIQKVFDVGIVPNLVDFMAAESNPHLIKEATWCLANITAGEGLYIKSIASSSFFDYLGRVLGSVHDGIYEQAVWIVGNISADDYEYREEMRRLRFPQIITERIVSQDSEKKELMKYSNWALSNLCRGDVTHRV